MIIRPIEMRDLDALMEMAEETGSGFTSLPDNIDFLREKITHSQQTFADPEGNGPGLYFFVLEDCNSPEETGSKTSPVIAGCCAIEARVGLSSPFYHYRLGRLAHSSPALGLHRMLETLFLSSDHTGDAEVCSLYLRPDWRGGAGLRGRLGTLLSRVRWVFMATHRRRFPARVLAEMRGQTDEEGNSAFWYGLGHRFLKMDFADADRLIGLGDKGFIGELMPKFPIYLNFLTPEARSAIGQVHQNTRPAIAMLKQEGLRWEGYIDIFDGGPTMEAYIDDVRAIRNTRSVAVALDASEHPDDNDDRIRPRWLVASGETPAAFRACWSRVGPQEGEITLHPEEAAKLGVKAGESVRILEC